MTGFAWRGPPSGPAPSRGQPNEEPSCGGRCGGGLERTAAQAADGNRFSEVGLIQSGSRREGRRGSRRSVTKACTEQRGHPCRLSKGSSGASCTRSRASALNLFGKGRWGSTPSKALLYTLDHAPTDGAAGICVAAVLPPPSCNSVFSPRTRATVRPTDANDRLHNAPHHTRAGHRLRRRHW